MQMSLKHTYENISPHNFRSFTVVEFEAYVKEKALAIGIDNVGTIGIILQDDEGTLGACFGGIIYGKWTISGFGFMSSLLNGKDFTILEVDDLINHELCHALVNMKYNENCGHDERFDDICTEYGCYSSPEKIKLGNMHDQYMTYFHIETINEYVNSSKYVLRCNRCGKVFKKSDKFDYEIFKLFLLCTSGLPLTCRNLEVKSTCCNAPYRYEFDSKLLLNQLRKLDILDELQSLIIKEENEYKSHSVG